MNFSGNRKIILFSCKNTEFLQNIYLCQEKTISISFMTFLVTEDHCVKKLLNGNKNYQKLKKSKTGNAETFRIDTLWIGTDNKITN
jgi:hypothetical protein